MLLAALWLMAGAATHLWLRVDDEQSAPWWLTVLIVLSWPIFAATQFANLKIELEVLERVE
jgi:hypothetical protein